jgi:hypothetical protein
MIPHKTEYSHQLSLGPRLREMHGETGQAGVGGIGLSCSLDLRPFLTQEGCLKKGMGSRMFTYLQIFYWIFLMLQNIW